jgi:hypothetical protein
MNKIKVVGIYLGLSVFAYFMYDSAWLVSFMLGPAEHFSLAVHALSNGGQYLDGQAHVSVSDIIFCAIEIVVWCIGLVASVVVFKGDKMKLKVLFFLAFWVLVGFLNIYLFSMRSV